MGVARPHSIVVAWFAFAAGCATARPAAVATAAGALRCLVADTGATTPDSIVAMMPGPSPSSATNCEGEPLVNVASPVVTIVPAPGNDLRDVIEGRLGHSRRPDVVVTSDAATIDLARRLGTYIVAPLPWSTTYVLATGPGLTTLPDESERASLARDAVGGDVRGALEPFPWRSDDACAHDLARPRGDIAMAVAYASGDVVARSLAERVASLAGSRARPAWLPDAGAARGAAWRTLGVPREALASTLASGGAVAAVVAIPRDPSAPCGTRSTSVPRGAIPLVDARPHVLVRRGSGAAFVVAADGSLHFVKRGTP